MRARLVIATLCGALLVSKAALAGPNETFGYGSRSTAMGGAVSANVDDVSANYYNPAGLAGAKGLTFDVGYVRAFYALKMNGKDNHVDPVRGLMFGLVAPGKVAGLPFAFGVGLHLPDDRVLRVRSLDQEQPRWEMYDNRPQRLFFAANLAIKPFPWLEVGGGMVFLAATRARLDITGDIPLASTKDSTLRHEVDADLTSIRYPQAGIRVTPIKRLRLSAVYRGEFQLTLDISARLDVGVSGIVRDPIPLSTYITTVSVNAFLPRQVVVGGSFDVTEALTVNLDLTWINWSSYKSPVTGVNARTQFDPPPGFPSNLTPEKPAPTLVLPPNFQDRVVPRVGLEARIPLGPKENGHHLAVRGGYFFERSPIPKQTGGTNFVDADRHAFSAGLGVRLHALGSVLPGDLKLDVHAMYSVLPTRTHEKTSAASLIGDYTAGGTIWSVGSTIGVVF